MMILHAPSVHVGGGLVLLRALLQAWPEQQPLRGWFDLRVRGSLPMPPLAEANWVPPTVRARLRAEREVRDSAQSCSTVLCFHGLPPIYRSAGRVLVFAQNRIHLGLIPLTRFPVRIALRLWLERTISRHFRSHVAEYIVQTPTMARELRRWHGGEAIVRVLPFADRTVAPFPLTESTRWDFVYVADGGAHKNHRRLLEAWVLLARDGLRPSLALTLSTSDPLLGEIETLRRNHNIAVHNVGTGTHEHALALIRASRALIYPSLGESFGLPLLEAGQMGRPIVAAERDYVRDVCVPVQTFDPESPISIARAVRRFIDQSEPLLQVRDPAAWWASLGEYKMQ